jgi:hypothetical protein
MVGSIDRLDNFGMAGWTCSDDGKKACRMRLDVDGVPTFLFIPREFRPDLAKAGWANGYCSVNVNFPKVLALLKPARVEVWNEETGSLLSRGAVVLDPAIKNSGKYRFEEAAFAASAAPLGIEHDGDICVVHGIASTERELKPQLIYGDAEVLSFEQEQRKSETGNAASLNARNFVMRTRSSGATSFSLFRVSPSGYGAERTAFAGYLAVPARGPGSLDVPAYENMARVSGPRVTPEIFVAAGLTTAAKLDGAARSFGGKPLNKFKRLLDWGAGIGRVARHIRNHFAPESEIWCVDVDGLNVAEASKFVKNCICKPIPYYPPTNLPTEYFDFVYGISVFTHLSECAQEVWLQELRRITQGGALLVMSINTEFAALHLSANEAGCMRDLLVLGISDHLLDGNLGSKLDRSNYYRSTYHLTHYVREEWGKHFEILDIVRQADVYVQDLVIMRKR